jgi:hypothetical protein
LPALSVIVHVPGNPAEKSSVKIGVIALCTGAGFWRRVSVFA